MYSIAMNDARNAQGAPRHAASRGAARRRRTRLRDRRSAARSERPRVRPAGRHVVSGPPSARARRFALKPLVGGEWTPPPRLSIDTDRPPRTHRAAGRLEAVRTGCPCRHRKPRMMSERIERYLDGVRRLLIAR